MELIFKMRYFFLFIGCLSLFHCVSKEQQTTVTFVDEFVIKDSLDFQQTIIGGLSGIDYDGENFYMVVDDAKQPRILKASIIFDGDTIQKIDFTDVIHLKDSSNFYKNNALDVESVLYDTINEEFHLVSEGFIKGGKSPAIFKVNSEGDFVENIDYPDYFKSKSKHNASFESTSRSIDNKGVWVAMEGVLEGDGEDPSFNTTNSPVRITFFENSTDKATKQFVYQLDNIEKPKKGNINLNGITAILMYKKNEFLIVERAYQSGYGSYGNTVKLYKASIYFDATNTIEMTSLSSSEIVPMKKELLLNFNDLKPQLTDGIIDNIEGITFGPKLSNGHQSLLLVSDDNFQLYDKQINQFIVLQLNE